VSERSRARAARNREAGQRQPGPDDRGPDGLLRGNGDIVPSPSAPPGAGYGGGPAGGDSGGDSGRGASAGGPAATVMYPVPAGPPPGGPRRVRLRLSFLLWLFGLLLAAVAAVVVLVVLRPASSGKSTAVATLTPSAARTSNPASPRPSASASTSPAGGSRVSSSAPASPGTSPAAPGPAGDTNLFTLTPVQSNYVTGYVTGPQRIGTAAYPNSVRLTCNSGDGATTSLVYNVAGFSFLNSTIGVPNDATNAAGNSMSITFFKDGATDQLGKTVNVSLDHPHKVHLSLDGASQLEVACAGTSDGGTNSAVPMDFALGNAVLSGS
jgi:hypothetical protein